MGQVIFVCEKCHALINDREAHWAWHAECHFVGSKICVLDETDEQIVPITVEVTQ